MQRKLYTLIVTAVMIAVSLVGCAWGSVSLSAFPDPVFRETLRWVYDSGWTEYDSNGEPYTVGKGDGILGDKEIERITGLVVSSSGIISLKGIEHLTALQALYCGGNQLTALDVSNNTALTRLECQNNQLTALDVSGCTALTHLGCDNNQLTALDVSGCTALRELGCYDNQLTELDLSHNAALTWLGCDNNQLTELDVSKNTALTSLCCETNQITTLDVSNNTALTHLWCYDNQLTALDVSKNTALTSLNCSHNQLTALDLSNNTALLPDYTGHSAVDYCNQKRSGLKVKKTSEGYYEVDMKDYVSQLENIDADSIYENESWIKPLSYDKEMGIITFSEPIRGLRYGYMTHVQNVHLTDVMDVTITNPLSVVALERYGSNTYGIICDMTDNSYLDSNGNPLNESAISRYSYSGYSRLGLTADGNSRLIIRVQTDKPGKVSFSFNDDIGAKLESLSRAELSASDQLNTTEMGNDVHQVSAVLVAPESFPEGKNFPSDTFKVHVKFTDEDGKVTEDDLELKIEAAPVMLIHGLWGSAEKTFGSESGPGIWHQLKENGFTVGVCDYDGSKGPSEILNGNYNRLYLRLWDMFDKYSERGIVCTKADIVAFGMGGLIAEKYLSDEGKDSNDGNNWSVWSYKQGMVRRVITIATPHRGTRWADLITSAPGKVLSLVDKTTNPLDLPLRLLMNTLIAGNNTFVASQSGLRELRTDTARDYVFPSGVPMYAIYGDISGWEDSVFEDAFKDIIFQSVAGVGVATAAAAAVVPIAVFAVISIPALATMAPALITFAPVMAAAITGTAMAIEIKDALKLLAAEAVTVFKTAMFDGDGHDLVVSVNSAAGGFGSASSGWKLLHWSLPKRDEVGKKIVSLLRGSADKFKIFGTGDNASNFSVNSNVIENSAKVSTNQDSTESFKFIEALNLRAYVDNPGTVTFSVTAQKPTSYDVYCTVCGDKAFKLFTIPAVEGTEQRFKVQIPFTSEDMEGANVFCFSHNPSDNKGTSLFISNVAQISPVLDEEIPKITTSKLSNGVRKKSYSLQLKASGTTPIIWTHTGELPAGLKLSTSGKISGTPTKAGSYTFTVKAENAAGESSKKFTLKVTQTTITGTVPTASTCKAAFTATIKASNGTSPYKWSISGGKLPDGLTLNTETGVIAGSPTTAGKFSFTVKAKDKNGVTATKTYTVTVTQTKISGTVSSTATRKGTFTSTLKAIGGAEPYTWSISEGALPNGLKLGEATGKITGSPTKAGKFTFTVKVVDKNGAAATKAYTVKVTQTTISGTIPSTATRKSTYAGTLTASNGAKPYTWSISKGELPDGLKLNETTGKITGSPTKAGKFTFTVKAVDKNKVAATKACTVKITQTTITGSILTAVSVKAPYSSALKAEGGASPYTWSVSSGKLPNGLTIKKEIGEISGTPTKAGSYTFTVKAVDKNKAASTKSFTVKITEPTISGTFKGGVVKAKYTSGTATVSGGTAPYTWTSTGTLPNGMTLKFSGAKATLSGTPKKAETFTFTLKATDKNGSVVSKKYTVKITQPTISGTFKNGVVKAKYTSGTATVSGGTAPYTWTSTGTLPTGMTLKFSGAKATLSGTPKKAGSFTFTLKATDKNGAAVSKKYTVKITKTEASSKEESQTDVKEETSTLEISDGITSLPNIDTEDGTATFTPSLLLRVESEDIVESYDGKDSDMVKVKANRPLHFIVNVTDVVVYVDDQAVESVRVSPEGNFTLPVEIVHDDFKVSAKSGEQESEEVYIIAE